MKKILTLLCLSLCLMGNTRCNKGRGLRPDVMMSALEAGDFTALIKVEGCGYQPVWASGFSYCRVMEGSSEGVTISFAAPNESKQCSGDSCVEIKFFNPSTGQPSFSKFFEKGKTVLSVKWKDLTGQDEFRPDDTGYWPFIYSIKWIGKDGFEHSAVNEGELRMRVYRMQLCEGSPSKCRSYLPLSDQESDSNFVWSKVIDGQLVKSTTGGRIYVGPPESQEF